ncbi:hypothetical protein VPH35_112169 [Triticum aestivum]
MDEIVKGIGFCQVKQIFAPYSPHCSRTLPGRRGRGLPGQGQGGRAAVPGRDGPVRQPPLPKDRVAEAPLVVDDEHRVGWDRGDQGLPWTHSLHRGGPVHLPQRAVACGFEAKEVSPMLCYAMLSIWRRVMSRRKGKVGRAWLLRRWVTLAMLQQDCVEEDSWQG